MNDVSRSSNQPAFLAGAGEMGMLILERDWSGSPLGPVDVWPQCLRVILGFLLRSPVVMVLLWGEDGVMLYNDAYASFAGGRHPEQLGMKVREGWPEVAAFNDHVMEVCLAGGTLRYRGQELVLDRHGRPERVWMNLDYSPVLDESGEPAGVLCVVAEITEHIAAQQRREAAEAALRAERDQGVLDNMGEAFVLLDREFRIVDMNAEAMRLETRPKEAILGKTHWEAHPSAAPEVGELYRTAMREKRAVSLEHRYVWPDGRDTWIDMRAYPAADGLAVFYRDVIDRKRADAALRESEARFRAAVGAVQGVLWTNDASGRMVGDQPGWAALTGQSREDYEGYGWTRAVHPDDAEPTVDAWNRAVAERRPFLFEHRVRRHDGEWRRFSVRAIPAFGAEGEIREWVGVHTDIEERRQAEAELRELNETLETRVAERTAERDRLWRNTQDIQIVIDEAGVFQAVNPAFTQILGWVPEQVVGRSVFEFIVPEDEALSNAALEHVRREALPVVENRYHHRDGGFRWISWVAAPEGGLIYASGRHITEQKAQAEALAEAEAALRQSQKMEAVGQLTGGLAHDFNNLLAGISGSLELMATRVTQGRHGDVERYMGAAQGAARRAAALTHRLLAFSRRQTLAPKVTDVNALVNGMEELIRRAVGPQVALECVTGSGVWPVEVDPNQLENALLNLAVNARDAMPDGGKLTIETANRWMDARAAREQELSPGQYVSLSVSDMGAGMTPEVVARAFDPFFTTKPLGVGTGLGLSMVYGFARQSGGQVRIYSEVDRGTRVSLYLPRYLGEAPEAEPTLEGEVAVPAGAGETVLVIDDEPVVRMLIVDVLQELGYSPLEAANGPEGLKVLQSKARVDLLITDVGLPGGLNGRQVADAARVLRPDLRVLFITGYAENAVMNHGHLDPGMQVLTKPFAVEDLKRRIGAILTEG